MPVELRPFHENDLHLLEQWSLAVHAEQYMSRTSPHVFQDHGIITAETLLWFAIENNGDCCGTVWLEKQTPITQTATLGILLGDETHFGKGIGRQAIALALQSAVEQAFASQIILNVRKNNPRAIACYRHCGFQILREGIKQKDGVEPILYYEMQMNLNVSQSSV